eukprot:TRINITY_DN3624_c0_g1_i1.p1 TRINITY_DN3624_c0_g1~~TRINITY_DN3624_c0_g1_i1.p1  ORF type:complete len:553 (-),score=233.95 TRINITY_DN3624_c0_g1_i1:77-1735(-)
MDVLRENFEEVKKEAKKAIRECDFCSFDLEMTGISHETAAHDSIQLIYERRCPSVRTFIPLQFGLAVWKKLPGSSSSYKCDSYCFFLMPSAENGRFDFMCKTSSIEFLAQNNYDFNKTFRHGISFFNREMADRMMRRISGTMSNTQGNQTERKLTDTDQAYIDKARAEIEEWLKGEEKSYTMSQTNVHYYRRSLLQNHILVEHPNVVIVSSNPAIELKRFTDEELAQYNEDLRKERTRKVKKAAGFQRIVEYIIEYKKPLVGHNLSFDICFLSEYFLRPLPPRIEQFREIFHEAFPTVYDTKVIATHPLFRDYPSYLEGHLRAIERHFPECVNVIHTNTTVDSFQLHNASFDALVTGIIFIKQLSIIDRKLNPIEAAAPASKEEEQKIPLLTSVKLLDPAQTAEGASETASSSSSSSGDNAMEKTFEGLVEGVADFLNIANFTVACELSLDPSKDLPSRDNFFYISEFDESHTTQTLLGACLSVIGENVSAKLNWINAKACVLIVDPRSSSRSMTELLEVLGTSTVFRAKSLVEAESNDAVEEPARKRARRS